MAIAHHWFVLFFKPRLKILRATCWEWRVDSVIGTTINRAREWHLQLFRERLGERRLCWLLTPHICAPPVSCSWWWPNTSNMANIYFFIFLRRVGIGIKPQQLLHTVLLMGMQNGPGWDEKIMTVQQRNQTWWPCNPAKATQLLYRNGSRIANWKDLYVEVRGQFSIVWVTGVIPR